MTEIEQQPTAGGRPAVAVDLEQAGFTDAVEVGRGGFGVVYRCTQAALNRTVAVKLLHTDLDTVSRERFIREGRAMGGLSGHPNVVDVLQVGVTYGGRPFIVMPFQALDSLSQRVRREGPLTWQEALRMGVRIAGALECAHRVGTLHRDVKPANILLSDYGEPQLTDFGIARIEDGFETASGAFTGSLAYSAPEVLSGSAPSPASDVYGLGAALFSMVAGRAAFERRTGEEIVAQYLRISGQPIPDLRAHDVPDDFCSAIERAMAKDPADRPARAEDFGHELQDVQRRAGLPVAEMALPVRARPGPDDADVTQVVDAGPTEVVAPADDRGRRSASQPLPIVDQPWEPGVLIRQPVRTAPPPVSQQTSPPVLGSPATGEHGLPPTPPAPPGGVPALGAPAPRPRRRKPVLITLVTVLSLLASVGVVGWFLWSGRGAEAPPVAQAPASPTVDPTAAWRALAPAPTARQQVATTVADGTIWVLGGLTDTGATTVVEGYDPAINLWKSGFDLPVPLHHAMAVTYRGEVVVLGGWQPEGADLTAVTSNRVFVQRGQGWEELPAMRGARAAGAAVVVGDEIVVTGGQADGKLVPTTEVFDGTRWRTRAPLPTPREHLAMVADGTYAYAIGGRELSADRNTAAFERYDPATRRWERLPDLPSPRGGIGATVADGRIVVLGGEDPTRVIGTVDAYDLRSGTWSSLPEMGTPRHGMAVGSVGNTVYALDGAAKPSHSASTATGEALVVPARRLQPAAAWRDLGDAPLARQFSGAAAADGTLYVAGGLTTGEATAVTLIYDSAIDTWKAGPDLPVPLHHASAVVFRGEVYVIGGWSPEGGDASAIDSNRVFVLRGGAWVEQPPLNRPRVAAAAAVAGDRIVVVGGQADGQLVPVTEVFDGTKWTDAVPIPTPREHLAATSDGRYVYAVGGRDLSADRNSAAFERFDPVAGSWERLPDLPTARGGLGAAFVDGWVVAAGGEEPTRVLDTVEAYDLATGAWRALAPLPTPRHGMAVATLGTSVVAVNGARRPGHAESAATVEALDFS